jgi:glycosyltransferase involved in cell wall biosynthesis
MPAQEDASRPPGPADVAVVIPVLNGGHLVLDAVTSVRRQGDIVVELVVVDNGSVDGTPDLLAQHGVRVVAEPLPGAGAARKAGVAATSAPLVMFVDHDDVLLPGVIDALATALLAEGGDVAHGAVLNVVMEDGATDYHHVDEPMSAPLPSSTLIRREAMDAYPPMADDNYSWITWITAVRDAGARVVRIPQTVCERRIHGANVTLADASYEQYFALIRARLDARRA